MIHASKAHLDTVGERYFEHQGVAFHYSLNCLKAAAMAFVHGLIPGVFVTGASDLVKELAGDRKSRGRKTRR